MNDFEAYYNDKMSEARRLSGDARKNFVDKLIEEISASPDPVRERKLKAARAAIARHMRDIDKQADLLGIEKSGLEKEQRRYAAWEEIGDVGSRPLKFTKPHSSQFHYLIEEIEDDEGRDLHQEKIHVFLIEHDWDAAFQNAKDFDGGEIDIPYPATCFELSVSGLRICMVFSEDPGTPATCRIFCRVKSHWTFADSFSRLGFGWKSSGDETLRVIFAPIAEACFRQVRAACIALDAEIARTDVVRAPHRLNQARVKRGKLPAFDYHVLSLANRSRPTKFENDDPDHEKIKRRLHFRRGHWRHYLNHKAWIRWTLVGDPDLGFIDKHYTL